MIYFCRQLLVALLTAALLFPAASEARTIPANSVIVTYDYDAFGILLHSTGSTPNNYLFAGEQFDPDLGLYYNRARYLSTSTGRFFNMDADEGDEDEPLSLHKYLYANGDPVGGIDPSGHQDTAEEVEAEGVGEELDATVGNGAFQLGNAVKAALEYGKPALAALGVFYGLLNPRSDFAGVTYDFQLAALTGGDFPDVSFGVERRVQNFSKPLGLTIIRLSYRSGASSQTSSVVRIKIGDDGSVSGSGGLNIKLYEKSLLFGKLFANLGFRVDSQLNLGAQFEFGFSATGSDVTAEPLSPSKVGIVVRSKKILLNLKNVRFHPELLTNAINIGDDSPL